MGRPSRPKALVDHLHLAEKRDVRKKTGEEGGKGLEVEDHSYQHSLSRTTGLVLDQTFPLSIDLYQEGVRLIFIVPVRGIERVCLTPVYLVVIHVETSRSFHGFFLNGMHPFLHGDAPLAGDGVPGRFTGSVLNSEVSVENPAEL